MSLENSIKILDYKILNISSMEQYNQSNIIPLQKFPKLLRLNGTPWTSERFCHYPQKIIIKFPYLVNLSQINILSNSKKISRKLQFYYYFPDDFEKDLFSLFINSLFFLVFPKLRNNSPLFSLFNSRI